jgi:cytochrome c-type biogenesis protein CcmH/NrfF
MALCLALHLALGGLGIAVAAAPLFATPAAAQSDVPVDSELSRRAHRYSEGVMSPFCPGRTLNDCPSPNAAALREWIKGKMRLGLSDTDIMNELVATYGKSIIAVPRNRTESTLPVLLLLCGLGVLGFALYRVTRRGVERKHIAIPKELEKRLDAELRSHGF